MRIGIMLRHLNQHQGGVLRYTDNLLREMLRLDTSHEFVLLYRDPRMLGKYTNGGRVSEIAIEAPSDFLWDQLAVPLAKKRKKLDLIFNPKYSLPLMTNCRTVFVCHGLDWYAMPWGSLWMDRLNHKYLIPRYARQADAIIAVSDSTRQHLMEYLGVEEGRIFTVYHGVDEVFREPISRERLEETRRIYRLPQRFFLFCGHIYPPKNLGRLLQAYARVGPKLGISLVLAGQHLWLCKKELALIDHLGISSWVVRPGWIDHQQLPPFYGLAEALLLPSLYESFGLPNLEAMSCGCPVVTANRYGPLELVGDAGMLVDPEDVDSIAHGMHQVATDPALRKRLVDAGRKRARDFTWKRCAEQTFRALERVLMAEAAEPFLTSTSHRPRY